jgi:hypothetical protein
MSRGRGRYLRRIKRRVDYLAEKIVQKPEAHGVQWEREELEALSWALRELEQERPLEGRQA